MKIDLGLVSIDVPSTVMPTMLVGIGPEDTTETKGDLYSAKETRKQRRAMSMSFVPFDRTKSDAEILEGDINRIQVGCRGKIMKLEDRAVGELKGKYCELDYLGPSSLQQRSFVFSVVAGGVLHTYTYTCLAGPPEAEARKEFLSIVDSMGPGSLFAGKR